MPIPNMIFEFIHFILMYCVSLYKNKSPITIIPINNTSVNLCKTNMDNLILTYISYCNQVIYNYKLITYNHATISDISDDYKINRTLLQNKYLTIFKKIKDDQSLNNYQQHEIIITYMELLYNHWDKNDDILYRIYIKHIDT